MDPIYVCSTSSSFLDFMCCLLFIEDKVKGKKSICLICCIQEHECRRNEDSFADTSSFAVHTVWNCRNSNFVTKVWSLKILSYVRTCNLTLEFYYRIPIKLFSVVQQQSNQRVSKEQNLGQGRYRERYFSSKERQGGPKLNEYLS